MEMIVQNVSNDTAEPRAPPLVKEVLTSTVTDVTLEKIPTVPEASDASRCNASIMHSHVENVDQCEKSKCEASSLIEERMLRMNLADDYKSSQDKEFLLSGENKVSVESLEKEAEVHRPKKRRPRKRRGANADVVNPSTASDSGPGKMREEQKERETSTHTKDASTEVSQEPKQKPMDKKFEKQGKDATKPSASIEKSGDPKPLVEELRAKEEAESNRKVPETLNDFIKQTTRCEPYMSFTGRLGDKYLQRMRPDVFENHVVGKLIQGFNFPSGRDPRDIV